MTQADRADVTEFEVVSLDGRDQITLILNGKTYNMSAAVAKVLASDIRAAVKRANVGETK